MLVIAVIRELFGAGTILGYPVFGSDYNPMLMMILPPGAFILIGYLVAGTKTLNAKLEKRRELKEKEAGANG